VAPTQQFARDEHQFNLVINWFHPRTNGSFSHHLRLTVTTNSTQLSAKNGSASVFKAQDASISVCEPSGHIDRCSCAINQSITPLHCQQ